MPRRARPVPARPHLFEVAISHPGIPGFHGLNMEAKFVDASVPGGGVVKLFWVEVVDGAPVLLVQAGRRSTPWEGGALDFGALGLGGPRDPGRDVWVAAIARLGERYALASAIHQERVSAAHEQVMARLVAQAAKAFEPVPEVVVPERSEYLVLV